MLEISSTGQRGEAAERCWFPYYFCQLYQWPLWMFLALPGRYQLFWVCLHKVNNKANVMFYNMSIWKMSFSLLLFIKQNSQSLSSRSVFNDFLTQSSCTRKLPKLNRKPQKYVNTTTFSSTHCSQRSVFSFIRIKTTFLRTEKLSVSKRARKGKSTQVKMKPKAVKVK